MSCYNSVWLCHMEWNILWKLLYNTRLTYTLQPRTHKRIHMVVLILDWPTLFNLEHTHTVCGTRKQELVPQEMEGARSKVSVSRFVITGKKQLVSTILLTLLLSSAEGKIKLHTCLLVMELDFRDAKSLKLGSSNGPRLPYLSVMNFSVFNLSEPWFSWL